MAREFTLQSAGGEPQGLRRADLLLLAAFCLLLFGYSMFGGRPLTMHEARLPESAREMQANHDWLIPRSGGRPWLERPPLPHWMTVLVSTLLGQHSDRVWVVRLPSVLMGCGTVLLAAWVAGRWFGRGVGLCAGFVLATGYEFYAYSTLAEEDIYLAFFVTLAVALFVRVEFFAPDDGRTSPVGGRSWTVVGFFLVLGLSNLIKGPLVGAVLVLAAVGSFLLWNWNARRMLRWAWLWGWLIFGGLALFWPWAVYHRYPNVLDNWLFDYHGTTQYDEPPWYYLLDPSCAVRVLAPWTPAALVGLWVTARAAWRQAHSPQRFLWCWAIVPVLVLSLPHRKHHHYLVPTLAPWAILAAVGLPAIARWMFGRPAWSRRPVFGLLVVGLPVAAAIWLLRHKIPVPTPVTAGLIVVWLLCVAAFYQGLWRTDGRLLLGAVIAGFFAIACVGQTFIADGDPGDILFLRQVEAQVPTDRPLFIDAASSRLGKNGELDFFRIAFYLRPSATLLHNLTFLRDQKIHAPRVDVVARLHDQAELEQLGSVRVLASSPKTRRETSPGDRLALFDLQFRPDLQRYPAPTPDQITVMQAMGRAPGPYCGPKP